MGAMLQIRIDEDLKNQATEVFDSLGIDLSTAVRMFLKKSVAMNGIPFDVKNEQKKAELRAVIKEMNDISKANGNSEMSIEEINEIITETRNAKK